MNQYDARCLQYEIEGLERKKQAVLLGSRFMRDGFGVMIFALNAVTGLLLLIGLTIIVGTILAPAPVNTQNLLLGIAVILICTLCWYTGRSLLNGLKRIGEKDVKSIDKAIAEKKVTLQIINHQ